MTATREDFAALSAIINSYRIPRMLQLVADDLRQAGSPRSLCISQDFWCAGQNRQRVGGESPPR